LLLRNGFFSIALILACFALSPQARAVCQEGCLTNNNTVLGDDALLNDTGLGNNTAIGSNALHSNTTAEANTAIGSQALRKNTTGESNVATGYQALLRNTTGFQNTAIGTFALIENTTGSNNTATGKEALEFNTTGSSNVAVGVDALKPNTTGFNNTGIGTGTLFRNKFGTDNTAIGVSALSNSKGSDNTAIGSNAGVSVLTAENVTCIGSNVAGADVSNTTWIGNVYAVATQSGTTAPVIVSDTGQLGTVVSSERFKKDIATMDKASETVLSLRPVTFHYKTDTKNTPQFGLIAEEVAKVNAALVLPDEQGKPYTVRYEAVNAMLLNEFLKEHHQVQDLKTTVAELQKQIEALTAGLQKVSAQLELSKSATQTALSNH